MTSFSLPGVGQNVAIIGTQWGDEGKGKLVDALSGQFDYVCRSTGGANAGHTIVVQGVKHVFHLMPSGLLHPNTVAIIGNGTAVNLPSLAKELDNLEKGGLNIEGRIKIASNAALLLEYHKMIDAEQERRKGDAKIGTTCRGIGPCYADKISRRGIRVGDILDTEKLKAQIAHNARIHSELYGLEIDAEFEWAQIEPHIARIAPLITDTVTFLNTGLGEGKRALFEGAQAHNLDIDHGTYPYVTSSNVSIGGVCTGLGVPPKEIDTVIGIAKAYTSRVGEGPFATELTGETGEQIRTVGHEFGSTTGRPRRCGWFDAVVVRHACMVNGIDQINLTKLDVLSNIETLKVGIGYNDDGTVEYEDFAGWSEDLSDCTTYDSLPPNAQAYVEGLERITGVPITSIGVGPNRSQLVVKPQ